MPAPAFRITVGSAAASGDSLVGRVGFEPTFFLGKNQVQSSFAIDPMRSLCRRTSSRPLESNQNLSGFSRARRPTTQERDMQLRGVSTASYEGIDTRAGSRRARSQTRSDALNASTLEQARAGRDHKRGRCQIIIVILFSCQGPAVRKAHLGRWRGPATAGRTSGDRVPVVTRDTPVSIRDLESDRESKTIYCRRPWTGELSLRSRSDVDVGHKLGPKRRRATWCSRVALEALRERKRHVMRWGGLRGYPYPYRRAKSHNGLGSTPTTGTPGRSLASPAWRLRFGYVDVVSTREPRNVDTNNRARRFRQTNFRRDL